MRKKKKLRTLDEEIQKESCDKFKKECLDESLEEFQKKKLKEYIIVEEFLDEFQLPDSTAFTWKLQHFGGCLLIMQDNFLTSYFIG